MAWIQGRLTGGNASHDGCCESEQPEDSADAQRVLDRAYAQRCHLGYQSDSIMHLTERHVQYVTLTLPVLLAP
jgi:hypothetical protein